jgi:anti-anti-sigma factor
MCSVEVDTTTTPCTVRLSGELNIYHAVAVRDAVFALFAQHQQLEIDLSGVNEIDTAGVQVLLAGRRETARDGGEMRFSRHSKCVDDVVGAMNLAGILGATDPSPVVR